MAAHHSGSARLDRLACVLASDHPPPPVAALQAHLLRAHAATPPAVLRSLLNRALRRLSKPRPHAALRLLLLMPRLPVSPDHFSLPFALNAAASLRLLPLGASFHALALRLALFPACLPVANALVDLYAKCNDLPAAHAALADIPVPDAVSFNSLLCTHARLASVPAAESLFASMPSRTQVSWNAMVVVYVNAGNVTSARRMFDEMPTRDSASWSVLIVGYCKCGSMRSAREMFDKMPAKNLVAWTAMINGYAQSGRPKASLALFREMEAAGIEPDAATMGAELPGWVGTYVDQKRIERNEKVLTALVNLHVRRGNVEQALSALVRLHSQMHTPILHLLVGWRHMGMQSWHFKCLKECKLRKSGLIQSLLSVCLLCAAIQGSLIKDWSIGRRWCRIMGRSAVKITMPVSLTCLALLSAECLQDTLQC